MKTAKRTLPESKTVALVAHDGCKPRLVQWALQHKDRLSKCTLVGTGTTATIVAESTGLSVQRYLSGPLGGDQQIGASISEGAIHVLIFFWDPLNAAPHDPDVKALLRLATLWNVAIATNESTADAVLMSPWFGVASEVTVPDGGEYVQHRAQSLKPTP